MTQIFKGKHTQHTWNNLQVKNSIYTSKLKHTRSIYEALSTRGSSKSG